MKGHNAVMRDNMIQNEILHMQVRIFRLACKKWNKTEKECADIFDSNMVDDYISEAYEFFHVQGDEANLDDIEHYLRGRGVSV